MHLLNHDQRQIIGMQYMCFVVIVGSANVNKLNKKYLEYTCILPWCYNVNCILLIDIIIAVNRIHIRVDAVFAAIFV